MKTVFSFAVTLVTFVTLVAIVPAYAFVDSSNLGDLSTEISALTAQSPSAPSVYKMTYSENFTCGYGCGPGTAQYVFTNISTGETKTSYIMSGGYFLPSTTLVLSDGATYTTYTPLKFTCPSNKKISAWVPATVFPTGSTITFTGCNYTAPCYVTCQ